jgi:S-methylmethionine-dependent homocysteine/selenocysteine methylase
MLSGHRPVILDGAMGTELHRRGCSIELPLWSARALLDEPELVVEIHRDYLRAGADILTTDTFRTTPRTFHRAGIPDQSQVMTGIAVALAHEARSTFADRHILIAGSMAPLEDCYRPDLVPPDNVLRTEHWQQAKTLADAGVDFLLLETMATAREAVAACDAARSTGKEVIVSFVCDSTGNLYGGDPLSETIHKLLPFQPSGFSINCVSPRHLPAALNHLTAATTLPFAVYANVGLPGDEMANRFVCEVSPQEYVTFARDWASRGAAIIGGCCGTTPDHIRELSRVFS